jgi:hypothetical protein
MNIMRIMATGVTASIMATAGGLLGQNVALAQDLTALPALPEAAAAAGLQEAPAQSPSEAAAATGLQEAPAQSLASVPVPPGVPQLTLSGPGGNSVHIFPTVAGAERLAAAAPDTGPLIYHAGGLIMPTVTVYPIFWVPAHLQNGGATGMSTDYQLVQEYLAFRYPGHGIANNNTQYYQNVGGAVTYIANAGGYAGAALDTIPYPQSGCTDSATPGNCITDAQIQAEVARVINVLHLSAGLDKIFLLYTSSGEGSCVNSASTSCAYTQYCAYHSAFTLGGVPVIYGNMPYGKVNACQIAGTPSPNADPAADAAATAASHEITEAITDPLLNAWFTAQGNEIGDLCAYNYGPNTWVSNHGIPANQFWSGTVYAYFELQREFDNHLHANGFAGCDQIGPGIAN